MCSVPRLNIMYSVQSVLSDHSYWYIIGQWQYFNITTLPLELLGSERNVIVDYHIKYSTLPRRIPWIAMSTTAFQQPTDNTDFTSLVCLLQEHLGPHGLDSQSVNVEHVMHIMQSYKSNRDDWNQYAHFDKGRYTRNLVDDGNGKYNLLVLCWPPGVARLLFEPLLSPAHF